MKDVVYPEDIEIARLERILGNGAQHALQEYGFDDLFAPGRDSLIHNDSDKSTASDSSKSSVYSSESEEHSLPAFLHPPDETPISEPVTCEFDGSKLTDMVSSSVTKYMNRLVETNVEEIVNGILTTRSFYETDGHMGIDLASIIVDSIANSYDQSATMGALFGAFLYCLHLKNPQVCHTCVSNLYAILHDAITSTSLYSTNTHTFMQSLTEENESEALINNLVEVLSYAIAFRGAAVTPLGNLLEIMLQSQVIITLVTDEGTALVEFYVLSPAMYRLMSKILRIANSLLLSLCPLQYKAISKQITRDSEIMKQILASPHASLEQRRFATRLQVYEAIIKEARSLGSHTKKDSPANPNLRGIYELIYSVKGGKQAVLQEHSLNDCFSIVSQIRRGPRDKHLESNTSEANQQSSGRSVDAIMSLLWDTVLNGVISEEFSTGSLQHRPTNSTGLRYSEGELVACKYFCFIFENIEQKVLEPDRFRTAWKSVCRSESPPDSMQHAFAKYASNQISYLSSQEGIEHNIVTYLDKPLQKLTIPSLFSIILIANADRSYTDHTLILLLRSIIAAPGRNDFRYQLGLAIWDYVAVLQNNSRQITNTARIVGYLLGCPTGSGVHGVSYSILKKHIVCDSSSIQTKSTRALLPLAIRTFYDFLFCLLLTGKTHKLDASSGTDMYHAKMAFGPLIGQIDQGLLTYNKYEEKETDGMSRVRCGTMLYLDDLLAAYVQKDKTVRKIVSHLYADGAVFEEHCAKLISLLLEKVKLAVVNRV